MNKLKRFLALFMVLSMMLGVVPFGVFAAEGDEAPAQETVAPVEETEAPAEETEVPAEETEAPAEETEAPAEETEAPVEETEVPAEEIVVSVEDTYEAPVLAATTGTKPADGTVSGEPFNTSVSKNYRIPGLVNFNGTLIATADARWDYEKDGGGMDLVVSRSTDGNTWNYTFAGYLGDNGNVWNSDSTTLMDPVIITDGETLYLLADMFPAGYSISSSSTTNTFSDTAIGFDGSGNLLLSGDSRSTYGYYLKDGKIYSTDGTEQTGYTVQGWYDLYLNGTYVTNLFFSDSPFQVRATSYICMSTSTDGANWTAPTLLNVKPSGVSWMVLGPGSGLVTADGNIAFTAYDGSNIYLIYGKDGQWNRVQTSAAGNESSIIELSDGTIRAFVKRGGSNTIAYVDFAYNENGSYTAGSLVDTGVANFSQCMVSSLYYSKTIDGQDVVLVCCPSYSAGGTWAGRFNGKIYVFTLDSTNAMTLAGSYQINNSFFAYSNMTELDDGTIALLYEDDCISYAAGNYYGTASHITYTTVDLADATGLTFDADEDITVDGSENVTNVEVSGATVEIKDIDVSEVDAVEGLAGSNYVAYGITLMDVNGNAYTGSATVTIPLNGKFAEGVELRGFVIGENGVEYIEEGVTRDGDTVTFTVPHFSVVGAEAVPAADTTVVNVEVPTGGSITKTYEGLIGTDGETGTLSNGVTYTVTQTPATSNVVNEWQLVTNGVSGITTTDKYLIVSASSGSAYALTSSGGATEVTITDGVISLDSVSADSNMVFTFSGSGSSWTIRGTTGYLYPTASRSKGSWSYSLSSSQSSSQTVSISGTSGITVSRSVTYYNTTDSYLTLDSSAGADNSSDTLYLFKLVNINESTAAKTTITFNGPAAATSTVSSVTLSDYTFNVSVKEIVYGDLFNGIVGTQTYEGDNGNVEMNGKAITALTTCVGTSFQLGTDVADADSIVWEVADTSIATVDENGNVTGVSSGDTTVTVTVTKNGVVDTATIPVHITGSFGSSTNTTTVCYYIEELTDTNAYYTLYSTNVSEELIQVIEGQVIYFERPVTVPFGMIWVAAPHEGYALTRMQATDTVGQYYPLHSGDRTLNTSSTNYYAGGSQGGYPYYNIYTYYGGNQTTMNTMLNKALAEPYLCDGAMSMGRKANDTSPKLGSSLTFRSEKLPEVSKSIISVDGKPYTEGMVAQVGKVVVFNVTVKQFAAEDDVTYSSETLTENLSGARFDSTDGSTTKSVTLSDTALSQDAEYSYQVYYTVKESDLDTTITNTVDFTYSYRSTYSTGSMEASASAQAKITATTFSAKDLVVDFGLPVTVHYDVWGAPVALDTTKGDATYGTVAVSGNTTSGWDVTYTPTKTLKGIDTVTMYGTNGAEYTFKVYPATTVYYEEGFMTMNGFSAGSMGTGSQATYVLGSSSDAYGYDAKYANETGMSNGTQATSTAVGSTAEFTFTGTGVDIYANSTTGTGAVAVKIKNSAGKLVKFYQVDTSVSAGTTAATSSKSGNFNSLPIVSVQDLSTAPDTYTVTITHIKRNSADAADVAVNLDGFRVFGTLAAATVRGNSSIYYNDKEDAPVYYQLRDMVLNALGVSGATSSQVYDAIQGAVALITDESVNYGDGVAQDLLNNGPKNELYLYNGHTLTFKVETDRAMQIGLKAPAGVTKYTMKYTVNGTTTTVKNNAEIKTSTDMFYALDNPTGSKLVYTVSITNNTGNPLSVTDLKICDDPNAVFQPLTTEDIVLLLPGVVEDGSGVTPVSASLSLAGDIGINFYYELSDAVVADPESKVVFTLPNGQTQTVALADALAVSEDGITQYRFSCTVSAKQMNDEITAQFYTTDGATGTAVNYSVVKYCAAVLAAESAFRMELVNLVKAMLNYGAAAQVMFGYNADALANETLSDADKVLTADDDLSAYKTLITGEEEGIRAYSASLLLESNTTIRYYFQLTGDKTIGDYEFAVNGEVVEPVASDNLYYVDMVEISAKDLDEAYTATVGGLSVTYSALSYVYSVRNYADASEAMLNAANALNLYNQAANAYFG